jgi:heme/copper-type cytochrome/quinol oxidase subunit 4
MQPSFLRAVKYLAIEEKILNLGAILAVVGVFMPWFGGEWFGEPQVWTGFGFYTSFVGLMIFLAHLFTLSLTVLPMLGYEVVRSSLKHLLRFIIGLESTLLTIVVLSVLTNVSFDFSQVEIRFGIYLTLVGSIVVALYAFLRMQQQRKREVEEIFHHTEAPEGGLHTLRTVSALPRVLRTDRGTGPREREPSLSSREASVSPPPPPPPAAAEDLSLFR